MLDITQPKPTATGTRAFAALLMAVALLLAGSVVLLAAQPAAAASTVEIDITNFAFQPATVTIQVGDTVTWTNHDSASHTATDTGSQSLFDGAMDQGQSFSYTFTQAGTFDYICTFHPEMTGTVIVQAASAPGASQLPDGAMRSPADPAAWQVPAASLFGGTLLAFSLLAAVAGARLRRQARRP